MSHDIFMSFRKSCQHSLLPTPDFTDTFSKIFTESVLVERLQPSRRALRDGRRPRQRLRRRLCGARGGGDLVNNPDLPICFLRSTQSPTKYSLIIKFSKFRKMMHHFASFLSATSVGFRRNLRTSLSISLIWSGA